MAIGDLLDGFTFGVEFNGWAATGVTPKLTDLDGVESLAGLRSGNLERGRAHGSIPGPLFAGNRLVTVEATMHGSPSVLRDQVDQLAAAAALSDLERPLVWVLGGMTQLRRANVRVVGRALPIDSAFAAGKAVATLQFEATDPRVYGNIERSDSTGVGAVTGGLAMPHGFPHGFGLAEAGTITTTNGGTYPAPWTATLTGPLTSPRIALVGTDGELRLDGFDLAAGDTLELDSRRRTIRLNGTASRAGSLTRRAWFDLPVGSAAVQLTAGAGTGELSLSWRDTWL